jgi:hypothetical protein
MMTNAGNEPRSERRRSDRRKERRPVLVSWQEAELQYREETFTVSISRYGCSVESKHNVPTATLVTVEQEGRSFTGKVSYVLRSSASTNYELGIGFDEDGSGFWGETF